MAFCTHFLPTPPDWRRLVLGGLCFLSSLCLQAAAPRLTDYEMIASYLPVFLRYVQWPEAGAPRSGAALRIGVLGRDPFGAALEKAIQGRKVAGRPIEILRGSGAEPLLECQIVFVNATGAERAKALAGLSGRPVLTVVYSTDRSVPQEPAAIEFVLAGTNVRYRLNSVVLAASGLRPTEGLIENALRGSDAGLAGLGKEPVAP